MLAELSEERPNEQKLLTKASVMGNFLFEEECKVVNVDRLSQSLNNERGGLINNLRITKLISKDLKGTVKSNED